MTSVLLNLREIILKLLFETNKLTIVSKLRRIVSNSYKKQKHRKMLERQQGAQGHTV